MHCGTGWGQIIALSSCLEKADRPVDGVPECILLFLSKHSSVGRWRGPPTETPGLAALVSVIKECERATSRDALRAALVPPPRPDSQPVRARVSLGWSVPSWLGLRGPRPAPPRSAAFLAPPLGGFTVDIAPLPHPSSPCLPANLRRLSPNIFPAKVSGTTGHFHQQEIPERLISACSPPHTGWLFSCRLTYTSSGSHSSHPTSSPISAEPETRGVERALPELSRVQSSETDAQGVAAHSLFKQDTPVFRLAAWRCWRDPAGPFPCSAARVPALFLTDSSPRARLRGASFPFQSAGPFSERHFNPPVRYIIHPPSERRHPPPLRAENSDSVWSPGPSARLNFLASARPVSRGRPRQPRPPAERHRLKSESAEKSTGL
ncbi:hypothetical protein SKAU_G00345550 [Synaphobranchus kaupii]|uniref:Uncharacterized protein n=1 Tax=Synaphobranchus kaupii TaxID=118154 RepID=A0A9Q1EJG7_SYNKA|nr:hypothetical protein SKAU_G00345550 [Synaphobranchus kaupii]